MYRYGETLDEYSHGEVDIIRFYVEGTDTIVFP